MSYGAVTGRAGHIHVAAEYLVEKKEPPKFYLVGIRLPGVVEVGVRQWLNILNCLSVEHAFRSGCGKRDGRHSGRRSRQRVDARLLTQSPAAERCDTIACSRL